MIDFSGIELPFTVEDLTETIVSFAHSGIWQFLIVSLSFFIASQLISYLIQQAFALREHNKYYSPENGYRSHYQYKSYKDWIIDDIERKKDNLRRLFK
jgi:hypothetical protein